MTSTTPIARPTKARRPTVADQIKDLILTRGLRPGDALPTEAELCEELSVSRSSVREAVRTLSTLDIVDVRHGHGTFVSGMSLAPMVEVLVFRGALSPGDSLQALRDVVEVRLALDLSMADRVVAANKGVESAEADALVVEMEERAARGESFLEADRAFHATLLESTGNRLAGQLITAFWDVHTAVIPQLGLPVPADILTTVRAHRDMLAAARAGDADAYRRAVVEHYEPLQRVLDERR